jgi:hypothetical protein
VAGILAVLLLFALVAMAMQRRPVLVLFCSPWILLLRCT